MPRPAFLLTFVILTWPPICPADEAPPKFQNGDIIFHTSRSSQSKAVQSATGSRYSHMGIIFLRDGSPFVFEAAATVKLTPVREWIARGVDSHYVVKRLAGSAEKLTPEILAKMKAEGEKLAGRPYDIAFGWTDDHIYCSELVWKIYQRAAGIEIGSLARLDSFDLTSPEVKTKIAERYPDGIPAAEPVISPAAMFACELLVELPLSTKP